MDTKEFYNKIRTDLFGGKLTPLQFSGITEILNAITEKGITDERYMAYILATAFHETAQTMQPIAEYGKGKNYDYGKKLKMGGGKGKRIPYSTPDKLYYGRGLCQITWYENYLSMGKLIGVDLLNNPDLALTPKVASEIILEGMLKGFFTGKALKDYFNNTLTDWVNARKIINGTDKAELIAGYAQKFYKAIKGV